MAEQVQMNIIARIHSDFSTKFGIPRQSGLVEELEAEIFFEPVMALTAPHDGLELMEKMIRELHEHLSPDGCAIFELSPWQNPLICTLGKSLKFKADAVNDLEGKARFVILQKECSPLCS